MESHANDDEYIKTRKTALDRVLKDVTDDKVKQEIHTKGLHWYWRVDSKLAYQLWLQMTSEERSIEQIFGLCKYMTTWRSEETSKYISGELTPDCTTVPYAIRAIDWTFVNWCMTLPEEQQYHLFQLRNVCDAYLSGDAKMYDCIRQQLLKLFPTSISVSDLDKELEKLQT